MRVQPTRNPARPASGHSPAMSEARLLSALATLRDALTPGQALDVPAVLDRSALLACLSVLTTNVPAPTPVPAPASALVVRPSRWNFAGYCIMCGERGCQSPQCITRFDGTVWTVCPSCNGTGCIANGYEPCTCLGGMVEVANDWPGSAY